MRRAVLTLLAAAAVIAVLWAILPDAEDAAPPAPPEPSGETPDAAPPELADPDDPGGTAEAQTGSDEEGYPVLLCGRVVRSGGGPVPGARVVFTPCYQLLSTDQVRSGLQSHFRRMARTDKTGRFAIRSEARPPSLKVFALLAFAEEKMAMLSEIPEGEAPIDVGDLVLVPATRIRVEVSTASGRPAPGAEVELRAGTHAPGLYPAWFEERCDREGVAVFLPLPVEADWTLFLTIRAANRADLGMAVEGALVLEDPTVRVVLDEGMRVTGRLLLPDGEPLSGTIVGVVGTGEPPGVLEDLLTLTRADGSFELAEVPTDGARLIVRDHARARMPYYLDEIRGASGRAVDLGEIRLGAPASIHGTLVDASGDPVSGANVQALLTGLDDQSPWAKTDEDGRFEIPGLPPGEYEVRASRWIPDFGAREGRAEGVRPGRGHVTVTLKPGNAVVLRFHPADDPSQPLSVRRGSVRLSPGLGGSGFRGSGRRLYRVRAEPGTYTIRFSSEGYRPVTIDGVRVVAHEDTVVDVLLEKE
ncbi:MAG: carboxypeptidase regulatory-like domain-containing protein [Planctomycetota bacterium]